MNKKKYRNKFYPTRDIKTFRELVTDAAKVEPDGAAFLIKQDPRHQYYEISYKRFENDLNAFIAAFVRNNIFQKKIALIGENSYHWVLSYISIVASGNIVVPIEKELKAGEIKNLIEFVEASVVIFSSKKEKDIREVTTNQLLLKLDGESTDEIITIEDFMNQSDSLDVDINIETDEHAVAVICFTSGTTGVAKGVMLSQRNILTNVINVSKYINVDGMINLSVLPMHHTYEMTCSILTAIYQRCTIAICDGLKYIAKNMKEAEANVMLGVPLIFEAIHRQIFKQAEKIGQRGKLKRAISFSLKLNIQNKKLLKRMFKSVHEALGGNIKLFISGAAAMDSEITKDFNAMGITMIQGYGMTEAAPLIAVNKDRYSKPAAAGLPLPGTDIIIDSPDENNIGEIICRSDAVMLGYYKNEEETEKVLQNGWLKTGDYGYFDSDGFLYISGRKKNVIVARNGKNVYPEEVEYYLMKSEAIGEAVVYGSSEKSSETVICAEIFPDFEYMKETYGTEDDEKIEEVIAGQIDIANDNLPNYKQVRRFTLRNEPFNKTASQKIIRPR